jgi:hypothetical protein
MDKVRFLNATKGWGLAGIEGLERRLEALEGLSLSPSQLITARKMRQRLYVKKALQRSDLSVRSGPESQTPPDRCKH